MHHQPPPQAGALRRGVSAVSGALLSPWGRCALLVALLAAAAWSVMASGPEQLLHSGWPRQLSGVESALAFTAAYAVCTLAFVPKPVLNAAAGALFGITWGLGLAVLGTTAGAALAFVLGRALGRDALRSLLPARALAAMDRQLGAHGFRSVLLMRLVPGVPFAAGNYSAAVSGTRTVPFLTATALGVVPNTAVYVVAGSHAATPDSLAFKTALAAIGAMGVLSAAAVWRVRRRGRIASSC